MALPRKVSVAVVTASDGSATAYTSNISGSVLAVKYAKTDYTDGVNFTITTESSAQNLWVDTNINASETVFPKRLNQGTDGADLTAIYDHVRAYDERVKIVIASGGDTKTGTFTVYYE